MGICYTATAGLIAKWFKKRRALANGIATGGTGFGGLTYSLAANALIQRMGIAWTFRIMAIICFVVLVTSALFLKDRKKGTKAPLTAFDLSLFKLPDFWLFLGWAWLSSFAYVAVVFSLSAYAQQVGFSAQQGSLVSAMFNRELKFLFDELCNTNDFVITVSTGIGRPIIGFMGDKFGTIRVNTIGTFLSAVFTFFLWIFGGKSYGALMVYGLLGMFPSIMWATFAVMTTSIFGLQKMQAGMYKISDFRRSGPLILFTQSYLF